MRSDAPSSTARAVATGVLMLSLDRELGHLVPPRAGEITRLFLTAFPGVTLAQLDRLRSGWFRALLWRVERVLYPGIVLHYTLRKRFLEDATREALGEGFGQVVVLGAGLDTLAARLHRDFPAAQFIEVDHPATQRVKRAALEAGAWAGDNLHLLAVDFTAQTLAGALAAHPAYRRDLPTLFIAEGVLMYLAEREVSALFGTLRSHGGPRSRIAFTFIGRRADGHISAGRQSRLVTAWLRRRGEPYRWGIAPAAAQAFLRAHGLAVRELCAPECARERYFPRRLRPDLPLGIEHLCVADYAAEESHVNGHSDLVPR